MKIRWTAQSVRYRIEPNELEALLQRERVEVQIAGVWRAVLEQGEETQLVTQAGSLAIVLSSQDVLLLAQPDQEGVYFQQETPPLRYYVEKDYPCVHPRASEAQELPSETFTQPKAEEKSV